MKKPELHRDDKIPGEISSLMLFNDDVNSFQDVIKALVEVCGHDPVQAEQCAVIVHFKGGFEIKSGSTAVLRSMSRSLNKRGLNTRVCPIL